MARQAARRESGHGQERPAEAAHGAVDAVIARVPASASQRAALEALWEMLAGGRRSTAERTVLFCRRVARDISPLLARDVLGALGMELESNGGSAALLASCAAAMDDPVAALAHARRVPARRWEQLDIARVAIEAAVACGEWEIARTGLKPLLEIETAEAWLLEAAFECGAATGAGGIAARDPVLARQAARELAARFPERTTGHAALIRVEAQAGDVAAAAARLEGLPAEMREHRAVRQAQAALLTAQGDVEPAAIAWWALLRRGGPPPALYLAGAAAMRSVQAAEEAARMITEGLALHPNSPRLLAAAGQVAKGAKRQADQLALLRREAALAPDDEELALQVIQLAREVGSGPRLQEALDRLRLHHVRFPRHAEAYEMHAELLRKAGRAEAAVKLLGEAAERFPDDVKIVLAQAELHADLGHTDKLADIVSRLRDRVPDDPEVEAAFLRALSGSGHHAQAERASLDAAARYPGALPVVLERGRVMTRQGKWPEAIEILEAEEAAARADGDERRAKRIEREIRMVRSLMEDVEPVQSGGGGGLLDAFESLGGVYTGCEFALVQKQSGVDRLGLLRWSQQTPEQLTAALQARFEGVGEPEFTRLDPYRAGAEAEYLSSDTRFGLRSHTFIPVPGNPPEVTLRSLGRRLRFLSGKLLEDIAAGERIMVYKAPDGLAEEALAGLAAALHAIGPAPLLVVVKAERAAEVGQVRLVAPGVAVGAITYFMRAGNAGLDVKGWRAVCAAALDVFGRAAAAAA